MVSKVSPERLVILGKGLLNLSIFFMKIKQRSSKSPQKKIILVIFDKLQIVFVSQVNLLIRLHVMVF